MNRKIAGGINMLIWTTRISKKKTVLAVCALAVLVTACILFSGQTQREPDSTLPQLTNNEERVAYLQSMGWEIAPEPVETLQFLLPEKLEEPYLSYNELQDSQGFDLSASCGKQVARYTYTVSNYPGRAAGVQANLYICEGFPIAGDILCAGKNGFQATLVYPEQT